MESHVKCLLSIYRVRVKSEKVLNLITQMASILLQIEVCLCKMHIHISVHKHQNILIL